MYFLSGLTLIAFWLLIGWFVGRTWMRWAPVRVKSPVSKWRSSIAVFGFAASNVSLASIMFLMVGGYIGHGYVLDHWLGTVALQITLLGAVVGILASLAGNKPLALPTAVCSIGCFLALLIQWLGR